MESARNKGLTLQLIIIVEAKNAVILNTFKKFCGKHTDLAWQYRINISELLAVFTVYPISTWGRGGGGGGRRNSPRAAFPASLRNKKSSLQLGNFFH